MGNCGSSTNCYGCYGEADGCVKAIEVDSDIAGPGVVVAFLIAASLACSSVIIGYFMDSLAETLLTDLDTGYIKFFQRSLFSTRLLPWIGGRWLKIKSTFYHLLGKNPPEERVSIPRHRRVAAVTRFLLAFSDQQMVSGLAIMTAALANRCHLTFYELEVVLCLAWFTAMTHLATLTALRQYFYDHPVVRNWRLLGITTFVVLLCFLQVIYILADGDATTPIQCIIDGTMRMTSYAPTNIISDVFYIFIWLLPSYAEATLALFSDPRIIYRRHGFSTFSLLQWLLPKSLRDDERKELGQNAIIQQHALLGLGIFKTVTRQPRTLRVYRLSFAEFLCDVVFGMMYGLLNVVHVVWRKSPKTTEGVRRMGFGQVVALMMIIIPVLTATEIYNDTRHPSFVNQYDQSSTPAAAAGPKTQGQQESIEEETATSRSIRPTLTVREALRAVYQYIDKELPDHDLTQQRVALISLSLFELSPDFTKHKCMPARKPHKQTVFRRWCFPLKAFSMTLLDSGTQLYVSLAYTVIYSPSRSWAALIISLWWFAIFMIDNLLELILLRKLVDQQLLFRSQMPTSDAGQKELLALILDLTRPWPCRRSTEGKESKDDGGEEPNAPRRQDTEADLGVLPPNDTDEGRVEACTCVITRDWAL